VATVSIFAPPVRGTFYRAIDPQYRDFAIAGSRSAGRYSRPNQPTLYLSSSVEGVQTAMIAHSEARGAVTETIALDVEASRIVDLRDAAAMSRAGVDPADAAAPWQHLAPEETPPSWKVRDVLVAAGAHGLIDPSRKSPGLWHLVLFRWNTPDSPTVNISTHRPPVPH